jgi:multidrug resistance efflux pump
VLNYKELVRTLARNEIVPQAEITETLKNVGQTEGQLHDHAEQQRRVDDLTTRISELRQFFAHGATLSDEIQITRKALREAEQAYAAWREEVREHGGSKNEELQKLEADLHVLWPKLVAELHEAGGRGARDW